MGDLISDNKDWRLLPKEEVHSILWVCWKDRPLARTRTTRIHTHTHVYIYIYILYYIYTYICAMHFARDASGILQDTAA